MALTLLTADVENVSALSDQPNDIDGLSAEELKAIFDAAGVAIKAFLNEVHIPEVENAIGAAARGIALEGLSGDVIKDHTIGSDKLNQTEGFEAVVTKNIRDFAVTRDKLEMSLQNLLSSLQSAVSQINTALGTKATYENLPTVAKTGNYNDLLDKPVIPAVDAVLSTAETSTNPVQNRIVAAALNGKAPTSHADGNTTYGTASDSLYGHVKLSDATNGTATAASGKTAATPKAVKDAYDRAGTAISNLNTHAAVKATNTTLGHIMMGAGTAELALGQTNWTVTPSGVTFSATDVVFVAPAAGSYSQWADNNVYCSGQGSNSLSFVASTAPSAKITVNVVVFKTT